MSTNQGLPAKAGTTPRPAEPRRERRLSVAVRVKVFPDTNSPESQTCITYEISTIGARLVAPAGVKAVGQIIGLQRHTRRARYKVVWIGKPETQHAGQVGVEIVDPNVVIWENELKTRLAQGAYIEESE